MDKHECCHEHNHDDTAEKISKIMPDEDVLYDAAELLKVFGDSTRLRIIFVLSQNELCVSEIASQLGMTQTAISHQLRVLKQARLVKARRNGKTIFYSLCDAHVQKIFYYAMEHVME